MKKITLLGLALGLTFAVSAQDRILSHSDSQVPDNGSVACADNTGLGTTENNFWRSYTPAAFGETGTISLQGGEVAIAATDISGSALPVNVFVTAFTSDDTFPAGTLTEVATSTISAEEGLEVYEFDFDEPVNADSATEIILKLVILDGTATGYDVRIGQNEEGETAPTYISTDSSCGPLPITTFDDLGFPGNGILNLRVGDEIATMGVNDNLSDVVSIFPNPTTDVLNVSVPSNVTVKSSSLIDVLGKDTGLRLSNGTINTSGLARGVYILNITTDRGSLTEKIVKQ
ncbi:MAG: hypothetical protein CMC70_03825 [Flavobacteriaceae bacterium]|nr:hypothetical protein [Flavobacteriaceae bacterium]